MNEPTLRTCSRYLRLLPWAVAAVLLLPWPLAWVGWPWSVFLSWLGCTAAVAALSSLTWHQTLQGYPFPPRTALVDARLLTSGDFALKAVRSPLKETRRMRFGAGSSALLLSHGAALLIEPDTDDAVLRGVLRGLEEMKLDQQQVSRRCPRLGEIERGGIVWQVFRDGEHERAYAMGAAADLLAQCQRIWNGSAAPFAETDRAALLTDCAACAIAPICVAMAEVHGGQLGEAVYLGTFFLEQVIRADAEKEIASLRREGLNVTLRGTNPWLLQDLASRLGCSVICPDRNPLVLTQEKRGEGAQIPIVPETMSLSHQTRLLMHMQRRLRVQPLVMGLVLAAVALCCLLCGLHVGTISVYTALLLLMTLPAFIRPARANQLPLRKTLMMLALALLPMVIASKLCGTFFAACGFMRLDAVIPALLPMMLLLGLLDMRGASRCKKATILAACGAGGVAMVAIFLLLGLGLLTTVFALLAGTLCAMPVWLFFMRSKKG